MTATWPGVGLPGILDPFLWIEILDPVLTTDMRTGHSADLIRVIGIVKPGEAALCLPAPASQAALNAAARALREELHRSAEDAVDAALKAGYALKDCPEISISGRLRHDRKTGLDMPEDIMARVTLWFRPPPET